MVLNALCLCLDKRKNEWIDLENQFKNTNIKFHKFIAGDGSDQELVYDHIDDPNPPVQYWGYGREGYKHHHYNAFQCHQKMIQIAKENYWREVLLLEDDAYLTDAFFKHFENSHSVLYYSNFDLAYYGWWIESLDKQSEELRQSNDFKIINHKGNIGGLHGLLVNHNMYDFILGLKPVNPVDYQINQYSDSILRALILPKMIHVKSMYSMTEGSCLEREKL